MKIDAKVRVKTAKGDLTADQLLKVPVDLDYVSDYDDVIQAVESRIYDDYGVSMYNTVDFEIENADELADEVVGNEDEEEH